MIIRRLQAENILKFTHLDIAFPLSGNVLISGDNESGKSAIIETICLGLFGRTANLNRDQTAKVVRWGSPRGWISLDITGANGQELSVYRHFSRQEAPQARLTLAGADEAVAVGEAGVDKAIAQAAGMEFHHFIETAYLSQGSPEGENPEAIVRMVAGVEKLEVLSSQLEGEIKSGREQLGQIASELTAIDQELGALNLNPRLLGELQQKHAQLLEKKGSLEAAIKEGNTGLGTLGSGYKGAASALSTTIQKGKQASLSTWSQNLKNLQSPLSSLSTQKLGEAAAVVTKLRGKAQSLLESLQAFSTIVDKTVQDGKSRSHWLSGTGPQTLAGEREELQTALANATRNRSSANLRFLFFFILGGPLAFAGFALHFLPGDPQLAPLSAFLTGAIPGFQPVHLFGAMGIGVLFLLISLSGLGKFFSSGTLKSQCNQSLQDLQARADSEQQIVDIVAKTSQLPLCQQVAQLGDLGDRVPWSDNLQQWLKSQGRELADEKSLAALLGSLNDDSSSMSKKMESIVQAMENELRDADEQLKTVTASVVTLEKELRNEQDRQNRDSALRARSQSLKDDRVRTAHGMDVRTLARQLIQGSCQEISVGFSYELRRLIARTAPMFTRGRYQHLKIDENLAVSAFSPVKNDFVDLSESSRGVRRQLMLSLRLALAQALTARTQSQSHFLILDEPFAHYDRDRFRESFQALSGVSDTFQQIFIVNQSFDEDLVSAAALHLHCVLDVDVIKVVSP